MSQKSHASKDESRMLQAALRAEVERAETKSADKELLLMRWREEGVRRLRAHENQPPDDLDPGIRMVVHWLRSHGFNTTDSGDGSTKPPGEAHLPFPHVFMLASPGTMVGEAQRLLALLRQVGVEVGDEGPVYVQASYSPIDGQEVVELGYLNDATLAAAPRLAHAEHDVIIPPGQQHRAQVQQQRRLKQEAAEATFAAHKAAKEFVDVVELPDPVHPPLTRTTRCIDVEGRTGGFIVCTCPECMAAQRNATDDPDAADSPHPTSPQGPQ